MKGYDNKDMLVISISSSNYIETILGTGYFLFKTTLQNCMGQLVYYWTNSSMQLPERQLLDYSPQPELL